tara:strand:- start:1073 stop:1393 length:321 start_codon:yes stop_codon:yes gene_type:complete
MTLPKNRQASNKIEKQQLIQDIRKMNPDITEKQLERYDIDDLRKIRMANTPQPVKGNTAGRPMMQQGGMADMSAAPMVQPRKKKTQSGFRSKYSKGGGVRATKYKL